MKNLPHNIHFVGIGGIGMSSLAQHLLQTGHAVSGSDRQHNPQTEKLQNMGVTVFVPHSPANIKNVQLVVRTSAVPTTNCEVTYALQHNIPVILREQLLGEIFDGFPTRIAVCGTHGKTTVTAMLHHVLERCGISHTAFIGGEYDGQNYFHGQNVVVAEACEYNRSFLQLHPTLCVCLNVEFDHPDCYKDQADVEKAFSQLFEQSKTVILPYAQSHLCNQANNVVAVGKDIVAKDVTVTDGFPQFTLFCDGVAVCPIKLGICGQHNVGNALAVVAAARQLGLPLLQVAQALSTFRGVDRRWTAVKGRLNVVCDYAHHPTEIATSVRTAKSLCKGKVICVFQPHTYTRTQTFFRQFVSCFDGADQVIYLPVYAAREQPIPSATSFQLYRYARCQGKQAKYCANFDSAAKLIQRTATPNDIIVLVGAGDVNTLVNLLV